MGNIDLGFEPVAPTGGKIGRGVGIENGLNGLGAVTVFGVMRSISTNLSNLLILTRIPYDSLLVPARARVTIRAEMAAVRASATAADLAKQRRHKSANRKYMPHRLLRLPGGLADLG